MKKVLILSDLHLDHSNFTPDTTNADIIVLAGDIAGRNSLIEDFFYYRIPRDKPVIYVPGNHEYEYHEFNEKNAYLENICAEFGVHFLFNKSIEINGIRFLGSPLFSNLTGFYKKYFPESDNAKNAPYRLKDWVENNISDFKLIRYSNSVAGEARWTVNDMIEQYNQSINFLNTELDKKFNGKTFVVTHFTPLFEFSKMNVPQEDLDKNSYWANHIPEIVEKADFWACGHTHTPKDFQQGKCLVLCNPRGYSEMLNIPENTNFNPQKIVLV